MLIPVIIPYFKAKEKLNKCTAAVQKQQGLQTTLFIRDNSDDNILYTRAINEGLRKFAFNPEIEFVLILTQDAYLKEPDTISKLVSVMRADSKVGIVSPIQMADGRITWGGSADAWPSGKHVFPGNVLQAHQTYWANGACMLFRTEMIKEIGMMDKNMRFICSDSDYSFTARSRGWKVMVAPDAVCEHSLDGSGSFGKNPWLDAIKLDDMIYFTEKWLSGGVYKWLSFEGQRLTPKVIRSQIYHWENAKKRLMTENSGLTPLNLGASEISQIRL